MRLKSLFLLDMRFQAKHGFYFLYVVLTVIYAVALLAVPESWKEKTAIILIFSDPASMGLFFMGAIVLLEKVSIHHVHLQFLLFVRWNILLPKLVHCLLFHLLSPLYWR